MDYSFFHVVTVIFVGDELFYRQIILFDVVLVCEHFFILLSRLFVTLFTVS